MTEPLAALRIGSKAQALLGTADVRWGVLAAVRGAIYIANRDGELVWITDQARALHSRALLLAAMPRNLPDPESRMHTSAGVLWCEEFEIPWRQAALVMPRATSTSDRHVEDFPDRVSDALRLVMDSRRDSTSLDYSAGSLKDGVKSAGKASAADTITDKLKRATRSLACVSSWDDVLPTLRSISYVVGLGQGLTPGGDDMLGGFLYTLRTLNETCSRMMPGIDWEGVMAWLHSVAHRTNAISRCMLLDHAHGVACSPLAELMRAALEGASGAQLAPLASDVAGIGASTGRNLLEGVGAACSVMQASARGSIRRHASQVKPVGGDCWRREVARVR